MKKLYDEFSRLSVDKMAQEMSDITFQYKNTNVPKTHYKKYLETNVEECIDTTVDLTILDVYVKTIKRLYEDSPKAFARAMLCIDNKINPSNIRPLEYEQLEFAIEQSLNVKNFKLCDNNLQIEYENAKEEILSIDDEQQESIEEFIGFAIKKVS